MAVPGPYSPDAADAGKRDLRSTVLALMTRLDGGQTAKALFDTADNMTEQVAALAQLIPTPHGPDAVQKFYNQWQADRLVMDKWFMIQPARANPEDALKVTKALEAHTDFNSKNPNRLRALIYGLASGNPAAFHQPDGAAYTWFADWIIRIDPANPQVAARAAGTFDAWRRYDADRQQMIRTELARIKATPNLSRDTTEMVTRILG